MCKVIGVVSLKGGVGKTSVVTSLGDAMSSFGKRVLLIDGNFSAPNLGLHLNIVDPEKTIHDVLGRKANAKDAIINLDNFDILPASLYEKSEINHFLLKDKIKSLKKYYDAIVIDSSPSLGDETLAVMLASDGLIVVTTPDIPTLSTTLKAVKLARQRGTQIDGIVLNKVYNKNFELNLDDIEDASSVPVMAVIPHDVNSLRAVSRFTPSTTLNPKSRGSEEFRRLAASLIGEKYKPVKLKRFFQWVNPTKQDINREIFYEQVFQD